MEGTDYLLDVILVESTKARHLTNGGIELNSDEQDEMDPNN